MKPFLGTLLVLLSVAWPAPQAAGDQAPPARPNVLLVMTDDQGYGELSVHGNPVLKTPHLDRLHAQSVRLADFHVAPMCTPTRGQLMTGVDCLRNRAMNVSSGRTLLRADLPTMADLFAAAGYSTGIFGKWHLGDNYPYRPQDRGFHETLCYPSSHIGSAPDAWDNHYFNDTYLHNGRRRAFEGYTTDVFFREAMRWMRQEARSGKPFFCYLPTAAPHAPHFVPAQYREAMDALMAKANLTALRPGVRDQLVRYLAMIANIDDNMGRLEEFLRESRLDDNTIVVFLTDNGSTFGPRYFNAGMKGGKVTLWEGGHRVPCFIRWPAGKLRAPGEVGGLTNVQDLLPTLLELAGVRTPARATFDGISLAGALRGTSEVPDRTLVVQFSRMNHPAPQQGDACVMWRRWRLVQDKEFYDLTADPGQQRNVIAQHPEPVARLRAHYARWWQGVQTGLNDPLRVVIGHDAEPEGLLSPCEWHDVFLDQGAQVRRGERKNGAWHLDVARAGEYEFELRRWPRERQAAIRAALPARTITDGTFPAGVALPVAKARLKIADVDRTADVNDAAVSASFRVPLPVGPATLQTWFLNADGRELCGAYYVYVRRVQTSPPVKVILDTDMSGDCDDAGALALLHTLADRGECELLATVVNRKDKTNSSAAAVDAINTFYGRGDLPIGTDKKGPTDLQRTSAYTRALREGFANDVGDDDRAPDALDVYRRVLAAQADGSVTICSVGALSNLAELWRQAPDLVKAKVRRLVVMGGQFPSSRKPETNVRTHREAARLVAAQWPTEIVWHGFEVGNVLITGSQLKRTPRSNPVRRAYELRQHAGRASIEGGQPSYDQAAALFAVRGAEPGLWQVVSGGRVEIDAEGVSTWTPDASARHSYVKIAGEPRRLAGAIETLMVAGPAK
ncbi:MAG: Arylsulfatase [Planctomycetes bacterium ADurb.Bin126]|nr:MAG: Arylsulfatase [Planctomycetes bacterium ADurb.Bin126]HOD79911.1 sulfatase-like hydrolase/transferase [Phycisphaerae bacterium]HQL73274.1 sulfatase-like hydrolase/transferase [Phycisphaerae bacterium]